MQDQFPEALNMEIKTGSENHWCGFLLPIVSPTKKSSVDVDNWPFLLYPAPSLRYSITVTFAFPFLWNTNGALLYEISEMKKKRRLYL